MSGCSMTLREKLRVAKALSELNVDIIEAGFPAASPGNFDAVKAIADADARREVMAKIEKIMQDEGVIIQPYWQSLYRHHKENVVNAEMHPSFEIHVHKLGFAA